MSDAHTRERPIPPLSLHPNPHDPSWQVSFHTLDGRRRGWFLVRAANRTEAQVVAAYQLAGDELLDEVYFTEGML